MHRPSYSGAVGAAGGRVEERSPISPAGSLRGRGRALLTQPVADTVLTWVSKEAEQRTPTASSAGTRCLAPQKPVVGRWSTVPLGKLILMANMEPSWQGESEEGGQSYHQTEIGGGAGRRGG